MTLRALLNGVEGAALTAVRGADNTYNVSLLDLNGLPVPLDGTNCAMVELFAAAARSDEPDFIFAITPDPTHDAAGFGSFTIPDENLSLSRTLYNLYVRHDDGTGTDFGDVLRINVVIAGTGYQTAPTVTITPADGVNGSGATATAALVGGVSTIVPPTITAAGTGYTTATCVFSDPPAGGTRATGTVQVSAGLVTGITVTSPGTGYTAPPTITINGPGTGATATCVLNAGVSGITVTAPGSGYKYGATVSIDAPPVGTAAQTRATATAVEGHGVTTVCDTPGSILVK